MSLINDIKGDLFTLRGLGVWFLTTLVFSGLGALWIIINVNFLGNDVAVTMLPDVPAIKSRR